MKWIKQSPLRISLVIPSDNYGRYLGDCLDSILSQNYPGLELVVMNCGSSDDSRSIIERHQKYLAYWQSRPDGGQYSAIEEGFRRTSGELMGWLNAGALMLLLLGSATTPCRNRRTRKASRPRRT